MTHEIRIAAKNQPWSWTFKDDDELELWRDGRPLGAFTAEAFLTRAERRS